MVERVPKLMMATTETTGKMLSIVENFENKLENCQGISKEIQKLSFPKVDAKHQENIRKMLAFLADMRSRKLGCINAVKQRIELTLNSRTIRSDPYRAGPKIRELEKLEV